MRTLKTSIAVCVACEEADQQAQVQPKRKLTEDAMPNQQKNPFILLILCILHSCVDALQLLMLDDH